MIEISTRKIGIDLMPSTELEEIAQNVLTIITTPKGSAPLDREFGIDGAYIDYPLASAQAKLTASITEAVKKFEPRARVERVIYLGQQSDGVLDAWVQISKANE